MKKRKILKNKYALLIVVVLVAFAVMGVNQILGQSAPGTLSVCKTNGGVLMARESCPGGMQTFDLVTGTVSGGGSIIPTVGNIAFIDNAYVLKKDETIWNYNGDQGGWSQKGSIPVDVDNVLQWSSNMFLTKSGILYRLDSSLGWVTNNP